MLPWTLLLIFKLEFLVSKKARKRKNRHRSDLKGRRKHISIQAEKILCRENPNKSPKQYCSQQMCSANEFRIKEQHTETHLYFYTVSMCVSK